MRDGLTLAEQKALIDAAIDLVGEMPACQSDGCCRPACVGLFGTMPTSCDDHVAEVGLRNLKTRHGWADSATRMIAVLRGIGVAP